MYVLRSWVACPRICSVSFGLRRRIDRVIPALYYCGPDVQPTGLISSLGVSVIRVVSPVNVATVSAHLNTNSCLKWGEDEQKKLMSVWYNNNIMYVPIAVGRFSPIVFPPLLFTYYYFIIICILRRRHCRQCLQRETLILKSLLLVYCLW